MQLRDRTSLEEGDLHRSNHLWRVVGVDRLSGLRVEARENAMEIGAAAPARQALQPRAQVFVSAWPLEQPFQRRPQVESRAADHHRRLSPSRDLLQCRARQPRVVAGAGFLMPIEDVDQVMGDAASFAGGRLRRTDVEAAIKLDRVVVDDLAAQTLGETDRQLALARRRRPQHGDERMPRLAHASAAWRSDRKYPSAKAQPICEVRVSPENSGVWSGMIR